MSWLSGRDIEVAVHYHANKATREAFQGVFSIDKLPFAIMQYPFFIVVNTQAHNLPGMDWIAVFIDRNRRGEVFDSLALPVPQPLMRWLNQFIRSYTRSRVMYQHPLSDTCGAFVVYFVFHRLKGTVTFSKSLQHNDNIVRSFYKELK